MRFTRLADWLRWQESLHPAAVALGLERVRIASARLGAVPAPIVITVGGTNGKGSCVAFLDAILRAAGYRVGCYTSPHLVRYNERITVDGAETSDDDLVAAFQRVDDARGDEQLTYFEFGTLAAFDILSRARLDAAVLEVGLGGRLDAVNVVDPDVSLITTVDIDHAEWLGEDRDAIGAEKAGIFRRGRPAVCGVDNPPASLLEAAARQSVPLWVAGRDYGFETTGNEWLWRAGPAVRRGLPLPGLRGPHQLHNAAAAIAVLQRLEDRLPVDQRALRAGLLAARVAGRFQVIRGAPTVVLDVAHNPEAARALSENLSRLPRGGRLLAVFGVLADKDVRGILQPLAEKVSHWYVAPVEGPRALMGAELAGRVRTVVTADRISMSDGIIDAFERALAAAGAEDVVLAFGSFLVVGAVLQHLDALPRQGVSST